MIRKPVAIAVVTAALGLSLTGCFQQRPDPCTTMMPAATAEQMAKVNQGLEVDESIEHDGYEVECVLNPDGTWTSEVED